MAGIQPARIDNTCCPICGRGIEPGMPELRLHLMDAGEVIIRVHDERCAAKAARHPETVAEAARVNQVAHVSAAGR